MRVVAPAARCFALTHPHQVDLVPDVRVGQEMGQVRPLATALGSRTGRTRSPPGRPVNTTANAPVWSHHEPLAGRAGADSPAGWARIEVPASWEAAVALVIAAGSCGCR